MPKQDTISVQICRGYCPQYYNETYPSIGNKDQAGAMQNVDLTDINKMTQGPGLANLTNGTQAGVVSTLIKSIMRTANTSDRTFGVGGAKFYEISSSTVTSNAANPTLPHTIDKGGVTGEDGEDLAYYQGAIYYSYNYTGGGDMGKYDLTRDSDADFDDDFGSTVPATGAAALANAPHQIIVGGDDILYCANGADICTYDGTTDTYNTAALDTPTNGIIESIAWANNRLYMAVNRPNLTGSNRVQSSVYLWDTISASWEYEIKIEEEISALYTLNGVVYVWTKDVSNTGGYKLSYIQGLNILPLAQYSGTLPAYYQISDYKGHLIWQSNGLIMAYGAGSKDVPTQLFQLADGGYSTVGAVANPFGTPMIASNESTNYKLAKFSGYSVDCNYKTLMWKVSTPSSKFQIDRIIVFTDQLASGAKVDTTLRYDFGKSNKALTQIAYATANKTRHIIGEGNLPLVENFRLEFDWSNGSTTNDCQIMGYAIEGHQTIYK